MILKKKIIYYFYMIFRLDVSLSVPTYMRKKMNKVLIGLGIIFVLILINHEYTQYKKFKYIEELLDVDLKEAKNKF